jgi:hypothetical protein
MVPDRVTMTKGPCSYCSFCLVTTFIVLCSIILFPLFHFSIYTDDKAITHLSPLYHLYETEVSCLPFFVFPFFFTHVHYSIVIRYIILVRYTTYTRLSIVIRVTFINRLWALPRLYKPTIHCDDLDCNSFYIHHGHIHSRICG